MADNTVASTTVASTGTPPTRTPPDAPPPLVSSRVLAAAFTALRIFTGLVWTGSTAAGRSDPVHARRHPLTRLREVACMSETSDEPRRSRSVDAVVLPDV